MNFRSRISGGLRNMANALEDFSEGVEQVLSGAQYALLDASAFVDGPESRVQSEKPSDADSEPVDPERETMLAWARDEFRWASPEEWEGDWLRTVYEHYHPAEPGIEDKRRMVLEWADNKHSPTGHLWRGSHVQDTDIEAAYDHIKSGDWQ